MNTNLGLADKTFNGVFCVHVKVEDNVAKTKPIAGLTVKADTHYIR